jgi:hypothetical protein
MKGKHPHLNKGVGRHGVVAALWNKHQSNINYPSISANSIASNRYFELQGHLLASFIDSRFRLSSLEFYERYDKKAERPIAPIGTDGISVAVRSLSLKEYSNIVAKIPSCTCTDDFARKIKGLDISSSVVGTEVDNLRIDSKLLGIRRYFTRFLRVLNGWKPPQNSHRSGGAGGGHARVHGFINAPGPTGVFIEEALPADQDPDIEIPTGQRFFVNAELPIEFAATQINPNAVEASGLAPSETLEEVFPLYSPDEIKGRIFKLHFQLLAAQASAQAFPFDTSQLTPTEISAVYLRAEQWIAEYSAPNQPSMNAGVRRIGGLLARIMFCFGQPLLQAWSMRVIWITKTSSIEDSPESDQITLIIKSAEVCDWKNAHVHGFRLNGIGPDYKSIAPENLVDIDRGLASNLVLPDLFGLGKQLLSYLEEHSLAELNGFGITLEAAKKAVSNFVESFHESRITAHKISSVLPCALTSLSGDQTLGWIVTADTRKANQTRMFYTRHTIEHLQDGYTHAAKRLAKTIGIRLAVPINKELQPNSFTSIGARFVISVEDARDMIELIIHHLTKPLPKVPTEAFFRAYHRIYTMYTHLYQSLETSIRAITRPNELFLMWKTSLREYGAICAPLSDKDTKYVDRARLVQISKTLGLQFTHHQKHLDHLDLHIKSAFSSITTRRDRYPFFTIDEQDRFKDLTPTDFAEFLKDYTLCDLPPNFHRGFLRSELLRRGCQAEVIDAHLGHFGFGESPQSFISSFDYGLHVARIETVLQEIRNDIGLRPIVSKIGFIRLRGKRQ